LESVGLGQLVEHPSAHGCRVGPAPSQGVSGQSKSKFFIKGTGTESSRYRPGIRVPKSKLKWQYRYFLVQNWSEKMKATGIQFRQLKHKSISSHNFIFSSALCSNQYFAH
jgi:hypothetical protein